MAAKDLDDEMDKDPEDESLLKTAVHHTVFKVSQDCGRHFHMEFSKPVIATIADNVYRAISGWGRDLELFAKHGKRKSVNPEDVRLLFRNNSAVYKQLGAMIERIDDKRVKKAEEREEKRKRKKQEEKEPKKQKAKKKSLGQGSSETVLDVVQPTRKNTDDDVEAVPVKNIAATMDLDVGFDNDFDF